MYVCPNDRQLALRARLGTGWSSRAQSAQGRTTMRLSTEEEEKILQVLRRNEILNKTEKNRVGTMLQRLERMKQDSSPHGRNECALCHQEFGRLSNLPLVCRDCGRLVCSACSFELPLRDSTRARFPCDRLRKSADLGSHSMASTPTHGPDSTKTRCRHASEHGASDSFLSSDFFLAMEKTAGRRIFGASNAVALSGHNLLERIRSRRSSKQSTTFVTICKICREAREIWKMSGAWFYKTLPRSQFTSAPLTPGFNVSSPSELVGPTVSGSISDNNFWVQVQPKNGPQASAEECSENTKKSAFSQRRSSHSVTVSKENCTELVKSPSASLENKKNDVSTTPNSTFNQIRKVIGSESPEKVGIKSSSSEANVSSWTTPSVGTVTTLPYHPAFATPKAPSTSAASALVSSFNMANTSRKVASLTGEKSLPLITPVPPPEAPRRTNPTDEAPFGILYFTLYHDTINKQLHVAIHKAKNLIAMDANGLSDPYVVCQILPSSPNSPRPRTSTRPQCLNPVWNEALTFEPFEEKNVQQKTLRLAVLDEDLYGSDWLGEYWLSLSRLPPDRLTDFAVPLGPRKPLHRGEYDLACPTRGKIQLGLRYDEERSQLCVEVIRCADLASMDANGLSDPFVKLYLRPDKAKKTKQKTHIKKGTLFPEFHEQFYYDMNASDASDRTLEVTVWDFDRGPSNDFIGGLTLGADAKAERRELWLAIFRPPYRRIEAWFQLSNRSENNSEPLSTPGICD